MCPREFPYKEAFYYKDERSHDFATKGDYAVVAGYTNYVDQLLIYAGLRATMGKRSSYSLDSVLEDELGINKDSYDVPMRQFSRWDYDRYFWYNVQDAHALSRLEAKNKDIDLIYQIAITTRTRVAKCWKKTISLRNLAVKYMLDEGYICSNNHNVDGNKGAKFRGAFVALPENNDNLGAEIFGARSNKVFDNVCDMDLASLYPSIILSCMVDPTNQFGKIAIMEERDGVEEDIVYDFIDDVIREDVIKLGHNWFNLPSKDELIHLIA
jgi:DNA polymerase elongation subunit (family B)